MTSRHRWILAGLVVLGIGVAGVLFLNRASAGEIRNVVLISIDTCRADHLSCYGFPQPVTPNIDAIAGEGVLFEQAVSPAPMTLPSHCSMLTGTNPPYHGVHHNINYRLGDSNVTLAEILSEQGFRTGAVVSGFPLDAQFGLDQGFETYEGKFRGKFNQDPHAEQKGGETSRLGMKWLERNGQDPFFLFLHYYDPHSPYEAPEPFASKFASRPYAGEIAYVDHCIGQVIAKLKSLKLYESTLLIITGDHGEGLGEHGESKHSFFIYQSTIHVPLIIRIPGRSQPRRVSDYVGLIDIMPTVLSLLGIEPISDLQGVDLSPYLGDDPVEENPRSLYTESKFPVSYDCGPLTGIFQNRWKYIQSPRAELYNLERDPDEKINLAQKEPLRASRMKDRLIRILEEQTRTNVEDSDFEVDQKSLERLRALGYIGGSSMKKGNEIDKSISDAIEFDETLPDAKDFIQVYENKAAASSRFFQMRKSLMRN